jgi:hypothetical protein
MLAMWTRIPGDLSSNFQEAVLFLKIPVRVS